MNTGRGARVRERSSASRLPCPPPPTSVCDINTLSCKFLKQSEIKATYLMALQSRLMPDAKGASVLFCTSVPSRPYFLPNSVQCGAGEDFNLEGASSYFSWKIYHGNSFGLQRPHYAHCSHTCLGSLVLCIHLPFMNEFLSLSQKVGATLVFLLPPAMEKQTPP